MDSEQIPPSSTAIVYLCVIAAISLYLYSKSRKTKPSTEYGLGHWSISTLDFSILLWFIITLFIFVPGLLQKLIPVETSSMGLSAILQTMPMVLTYFILLRFTQVMGQVNTQTLKPLNAIGDGLFSFLSRYPIVIISGMLSAAIILMLQQIGLDIEYNAQEYVSALLKNNSTIEWIAMSVGAAVLAPISEELTFRGVLFRFLRTRVPRWSALGISALIFAAIHLSVSQFLPLFVLGLLLALAYEKSGNIMVPIAFHAFFNLNTIIILYLY